MKTRLLFALIITFFLSIFLTVFIGSQPKQPMISPIPEITPTPTIAPEYSPTPTPKPTTSWTGFVSHYSENGCLGCSATLTMANGERFDETKMTLAFNHLPMNTVVRVTNLDNGKTIIARVTDRGGFEKYGRLADLSLALATHLEAKTDVSKIKIEVIN